MAVPEIIENGTSGFTFEPGDDHDLADSVIRMLDDPDHASKMADVGFRRLHDHFHIRINVERTECLYREILGLG